MNSLSTIRDQLLDEVATKTSLFEEQSRQIAVNIIIFLVLILIKLFNS